MTILISTPQQLQNINSNLNQSYELTNDIDMTGFNFTPIGNLSNRFKGQFDGKGYRIKNLSINTTTVNTGLFGYAQDATIKNVGLEDVNVNSTANYTGGLVGQLIDTTISNCYTTGNVKGNYGVGGLVGWYTAISSSHIDNCYTTATIEGAGRAGGLIGNIADVTCFINNCYANSIVTTTNASWLDRNRALIGDKHASVSNDNFTNLYYNIDTNDNSDVGIGLTTTQFANSSNFSTFDTSIWGFVDYPYLKIFGEPEIEIITKKEIRTLTSHSKPFESILERSKRKFQLSVSHSNKIDSEVARGLTQRVTSYIDEIVSNVITLQNANIKTHQVESYALSIDSTLNKSIRATRVIDSHLEPINTIIDIYVPVDETKVITAHVSFIENNSDTMSSLNQSQLIMIENPTRLEVK